MKLKIAKSIPFACINTSGKTKTWGSCVPTQDTTDTALVFPSRLSTSPSE